MYSINTTESLLLDICDQRANYLENIKWSLALGRKLEFLVHIIHIIEQTMFMMESLTDAE